MERYTVKQVIKLEEKKEFLGNLRRERLNDELYFPLTLLVGMGMAVSAAYFQGDNQSIIPLVAGVLAQVAGGSTMAYLETVDARYSKLIDKLDNVYSTMGNEFKTDVQNIRSGRTR